MRTPRRYRIGLRAFPRAYRRDRRTEIETTLAEISETTGGPSMKEAFGLIRSGLSIRIQGTTPQSIPGDLTLLLAASIALSAAFAPGRFWSLGSEYGLPTVAGPSPWTRLALAAAAVFAASVAVGLRRQRPLPIWVPGLAVGALAALGVFAATFTATLPAGSWWVSPGLNRPTGVAVVAVAAGTSLAARLLARLPVPAQLGLAAAAVASAAFFAALPILNVNIGIAGFGAIASGLLALRAGSATFGAPGRSA